MYFLFLRFFCKRSYRTQFFVLFYWKTVVYEQFYLVYCVQQSLPEWHSILWNSCCAVETIKFLYVVKYTAAFDENANFLCRWHQKRCRPMTNTSHVMTAVYTFFFPPCLQVRFWGPTQGNRRAPEGTRRSRNWRRSSSQSADSPEGNYRQPR